MKGIMRRTLAVVLLFAMCLQLPMKAMAFEGAEAGQFRVDFVCDANSSVAVYGNQELTGEAELNAKNAFPRNSSTGELDFTGEGQVNFVVSIAEGYNLDSVNATAGKGNYKNLKAISSADNTFVYRLTKITGDVEITVVTSAKEPEEEENNTPAEEVKGIKVAFVSGQDANVFVYTTQDITGEGQDTDLAYARNSETGEIDSTGEGQVNFKVVANEGYVLKGLEVLSGAGNYKNLKEITVSETEGVYRLTKVKGEITIAVNTEAAKATNSREDVVDAYNQALSMVPKYYQQYYTEETVEVVKNCLESLPQSVDALEINEIEALSENITEAVNQLKFKTAEVPQIYISTVDGVGNKLKKVDGYVATGIAVVDVDGEVLSSDGTMKVRGNTTAFAEKKAFNIKFESKKDVLGMGAAKKWNLMANAFDVTLMRNYIAVNLAHQMGLEYTSEQKYVELWVDGVFKGCYLLMEAVQAGSTRVDIDMDAGEFLVQFERDRDEEGVSYVTTTEGLRFELCDPDEPTEEQYQHIEKVLNDVTTAINSGDFEQVKDIIDTASFAKFYLLNEYMKNVDFNFSSVYFYYKGGKLYAGPVWDFDMSTGNIYKEGEAKYDSLIAYRGNWYRYLFKYSEFQKIVTDCFNLYHENLTDFYVEGGLLDRTVKEYGAVFARNFKEAGWDVSKQYNRYMRQPKPTYEENVEYLRDWLYNRDLYLTNYFENVTPNAWLYDPVAGDNHIEISWRPEADVDYYRVQRTSPNGKAELVSGRLTDTHFSDYSAEAGVEYTYDVVTVKNGVKNVSAYPGKIACLSEKTEKELVITKQPKNTSFAKNGEEVSFSVEADGDGLSYMWYYKEASNDRFVKSGVDTATYTKKIYTKNDGIEFYCVISDQYGHVVNSDTVKAEFKQSEANALAIVSQPKNIEIVKSGEAASLTVEATGDGLSYMWYYKTPDSDRFVKSGVTTATYVKKIYTKNDGIQFYCVISDQYGNKVTTETVKAEFKKSDAQAIVIVSQPKDIILKASEYATFSVKAEGDGLSYSWYYKSAEPDSDGLFHKAGVYTNEYVRRAWTKSNGMQFYCVIKDANGNTSQTTVVTLTVE